jgi:conjugative coupling factor TraD (TOL family)
VSSHAVLEAQLRPPIELWSAAVAWGIAVLAVTAPWALMMPPVLGLIAAVLATGFGWIRFRQALQVLRYQRGLKFSKITRVAPSKLSVDKSKHLYLGQGFEWTPQHTQRKLDAERKDAEPFVRPSGLESRLSAVGTRMLNAVADNIAAAENAGLPLSRQAQWARFITAVGGPLNPLYPNVDLGGSPILHGVGAQEECPVVLRQTARAGHLLVMGTTRVGKTRLLELLATQDIHAGHVTIVVDPKGDSELMLRLYAEARRTGRQDQFYLFHLGFPDVSARYNGIGNFSRITEVAARATNALPSAGNSAAFKEFSWRFTNIVAQAQVALGRIPTYSTLLRDVTGIEPLFMEYAHMVFRTRAERSEFTNYQQRLETIQGLVETKKIAVDRPISTRTPDVVAMIHWIKESRIVDNVLHGLVGAVSYDRSFYEKIIASLGPFLEKLTSGAVGQLISPDYFDPDDERPIFDWMTVIRQGGIVYVGLDALTDSAVAMAVGNSMFADLVSVAGEIYKRGPGRKVCLHLDEFSDLAGDEFVPMANKVRGAGFQLNVYTQTSADLEARLGSRAKAEQIAGNLNTIVMFRVKNVATAEQLTQGLPEVEVAALTAVSGATDVAGEGTGVDFVSRNEDRIATQSVPLVSPSDVMALPKGQAFALLEGGQLWKVRLPMLDPVGDEHLPASIVDLADRMARSYRTSELWWHDAELGSGAAGTWDAAEPVEAPTDTTEEAGGPSMLKEAAGE